MHNNSFLVFPILVLLSFSLQLDAASPDDVETRILFISSYGSSFTSSSKQLDGIRSAFGTENPCKIDCEYMDCIRFPGDSTNIRLFSEKIRYKVQVLHRYNLAIVADDDAFDFAVAERNRIFSGIPIVFLGVNDKEKALEYSGDLQITGVLEDVSIKNNLDLMIKLFPASDVVYVINDNNTTGRILKRSFDEVWKKGRYGKKLVFLNQSEMTFGDMCLKLKKIPSDAPVLLMTDYLDNTGKAISFEESIEFVSDNTSAPVFILWSLGIGHGFLGGYVTYLFEQGKQAGMMAKAIIDGESPSSLPIQAPDSDSYVFDYRQLTRFRIPLSSLPKGSKILFRSNSFYRQNILEVWLGSIVSFLMLIIVYVMVTNRIKMKKMIDVLVEEKNKALEADKRKSAFLANMSHEIRTPLNAIVGFSELLTDIDDKELRAQYIDIINQNNDSLLRIVSDILDLSKIESGAVEFHSEAFDLADLYKSLYGGMRDLCTSPDVEFRGINPYKKCIVALDKSRVSQVWTKYIENAIKYTKKGYVLMGYEQVNGGIRIYTKDTGIGIPDNKRSVVYQRFEKFDNFSKGTGLGLAICKAIVIRLNGNVGFESEDGKGSTFWAWIPCTAEIVNK